MRTLFVKFEYKKNGAISTFSMKLAAWDEPEKIVKSLKSRKRKLIAAWIVEDLKTK